jgi:hypothetical protein
MIPVLDFPIPKSDIKAKCVIVIDANKIVVVELLF